MKKNILILSTSPRKNGNSEMLAREFARGAEEAGHNVELLSLHDKTIGFCKGCLACQKTQRCVIHDDADAIVRKMKDAEVIAFATPIYFYEMCGQMKTLLDRSNPLFPSDYAFRDIYLLATAADSAESSMDGAVKGLDASLVRGVGGGTGADGAGTILHVPAALKSAFELGNKA